MKARKCIAWLLLVVMILALAPRSSLAAPPVGPCDGRDSARNQGNHSWYPVDKKAPTCTGSGYVEYLCSYCKQTYRDLIAPPGHDWGSPTVVKDPTCTEDGLQKTVCRRDSSHVRTKTIPALGHDWTEWYVVKWPTLGMEGLEERKCQRCGLTEQRTIPPLGAMDLYGLSLVMTQTAPGGSAFDYADVFDENGGVVFSYYVTLINTGMAPLNVTDFVGGAGEGSAISTVVLYPGQSHSFHLPWALAPGEVTPALSSSAIYGKVHYGFYFFGDSLDGEEHVCCSNTVSFSYEVKLPTGFEEWAPPTDSAVTVTMAESSASSDPNGYQLGETVRFHVRDTNAGEVTIGSIAVYDAVLGESERSLWTDYDVPVNGYHESFDVTHVVNAEDVNRGYISNYAIARWTDPDSGAALEAHSLPVTVPVINRAGIVLYKYVEGSPANGMFYVPGETVHFKVDVINNTDETRSEVWVFDPIMAESKAVYDLAPGQTKTVSFDYEVTEAEALTGKLDNYAQTDPDIYSNVVWVDTGLEIPFGVITALEVTKIETSTYANGMGYELGDIITYDIVVKNVGETVIPEGTVHDSLLPGSGEIGSFENLHPDASRIFHFSHEVTQADVDAQKVVNQAYVWVDNWVTASNRVESPTWGETTPPVKKPPLGEEDCCTRTLTGRGANVDAFDVHFCGEHLKVLEELDALKAQAATEEQELAYLEAARTAWQGAMDRMYEAARENVDSETAAALMNQRLTFLAYMDSYETLLASLYPDAPLTVARELEKEWRERCVDLCYELHAAPDQRPDSILGSHETLPEAAAGETCVRTEAERDGAELPNTQAYCGDHAAANGKVAALTAGAKNPQARTNAFLQAQRIWQTMMDARTNARYKAADKEARIIIARNRLAFDKYLTARQALLSCLYPDQPEVAAEVVARVIQDKETDLCRLWK